MENVVIKAEGISREFSFDGGSVSALKPLDLEVHGGKILAIVGKSGSGKSTLCNVLSGLDRPSTGTVSFLGQDLGGLADRETAELRAKHIGFVLQKDNLVPYLTLEENVAAPLVFAGQKLSVAISVASAMLARVGLAGRGSALPSHVSGGEAQRAAVARACAGSPRVVFADEPTGALDQENGATVWELFKDIVKERGAAGVIVTHDLDLAAGADEFITLADGRVIAGKGR